MDTVIRDDEMRDLELAVSLLREIAVQHSSYAQFYQPTVQQARNVLHSLRTRAANLPEQRAMPTPDPSVA